MQEQHRVVRAYSEDTERPYYQIRYRLSLTGRELLADAFAAAEDGGRVGRADSVSTTIPEHGNGAAVPTDYDWFNNPGDLDQLYPGGRIARSRSVENTSESMNMPELIQISSNTPGTPRTANRRPTQQKQFLDASGSGPSQANPTDMDICPDSMPALRGNGELRRSKSAGTASELHLNRGAPAMPIESFYDQPNNSKGMQRQGYPQLIAEFEGSITCLNSKNVRKYRIGQSYRNGVIVGIDDMQGKIIVYQKQLPRSTLIVMRTDSPTRYEKGYTVQDVKGNTIGSVHAIDRAQGLLVVNTTSAASNMYSIQY